MSEILITPDGGKLTIYSKAERDRWVEMLGKQADYFVESPQFVMDQLGWDEPRYARNDPFSGGLEVWTNEYGEGAAPPVTYPDGFLDAFPKPLARDFPKFDVSFKQAISRWGDDVKVFKGVARDPRVTQTQWENAERQFLIYGMGRPRSVENIYGFWIRFPESAIPWYEVDCYTVASDVAMEIARYQIELVLHGQTPENLHPLTQAFIRYATAG